MPTILMGVQISPKVPNGNTFAIIDKAIQVIQQSGIKHQVCPLETVMEGEWQELVNIVEKAQQACFDAGATDVMTTMRIHSRKDGDVTADEKMANYRQYQP
ncbi:MAG: MTH1187 family thiamine-binding protein [bacterium]